MKRVANLIVAILLFCLPRVLNAQDGMPRLILPATLANDFSDLPPVQNAIEFYQGLIRRNPGDAVSYLSLAQCYMRQGRETGDAGSYAKAESSLSMALRLSPQSPPARTSLAVVYYSQHRFSEALALSRDLIAEDPNSRDALAVWGDVNLALGNYGEAENVYQKLIAKNSGAAMLARMAQIAELKGKRREALKLMNRAVQDALNHEGTGAGVAWYLFRLAELNFHSGELSEAARMYAAAAQVFPQSYPALAGLGKVSAAHGRYRDAIAYYQKAIAIAPQPDFLSALGDLYRVTGDNENAQKQYATVEYIGRLAEINRQIYNRQLANFYSDHDIHPEKALQLALAELKSRKDMLGYDAAAWAYLKNGNAANASRMIEAALRFGTQDARLYYHAGMIAKAMGQNSNAGRLLSRALQINAHFDLLQAKIARDALSRLKNR